MTAALADCLAEVRRAPRGLHVTAYFDYDGTVIDGYSAGAFYRHRLRSLSIGVPEMLRTVVAGLRGIHSREDFEYFLALSLDAWKGHPASELDELGEGLFRNEIADRLHLEVWQLVQAHREQGHRVVLASSATRFQVVPMARELEADDVLCTELEEKDGLLTGRVRGRSLWGAGKAEAVVDDARRHQVDLASSFAYSNGDEDLPFLENVGHPVAVAPTDALRADAGARGWPVLECVPRGGPFPGIGEIARTAGFYAGMVGAFATAGGIGLVRRSRRTAVDLASSLGTDVGFGLAGIDVTVQGVEHLWAARPCVFVFNHQSNIDVPLMMKLLRGGFTGVAKKEAAAIPMWGQFFRFADVAFVDRGDTTAARQALEPAVRKLREEGISLAISPEGTRSATPRLGRFKKGPFHIAMQAQVPMVAIVIRNAGEVMARGAQTLRPGTVEVCVLPPVDTSSWTPGTIDRHVAEVHEMFRQTLVHWPAQVRGAEGAGT